MEHVADEILAKLAVLEERTEQILARMDDHKQEHRAIDTDRKAHGESIASLNTAVKLALGMAALPTTALVGAGVKLVFDLISK